jgi:deoxyribodipyrimidine photo-lyase
MNSLYILNGNARLQSNDALSYAYKTGRKVIPIFLDDTKIYPEGSASRWWYREIFRHIRNDGIDGRYHMVRSSGEYLLILKQIIIQNNVEEILIHGIPRTNFLNAIESIRENLNKFVNVKVFQSNNLLSVEQMLNMSVNFFNFSSFYKKIDEMVFKNPYPESCNTPEFISMSGENKQFTPRWGNKLRNVWKPHMDSRDLIHNMELNDDKIEGNRISPYVSHGQIDVRDLWEYAKNLGKDGEKIKRNVAWREFFYLSYLKRLNMDRVESNVKFRSFPWSDNGEGFLSWRSGATGFSIVDAAMKQLWAEGWISNELRTVTADFLTKCLMVKWDYGARWFMDTLVDADESVNYPSWQYISGVGGFSWPFFRIFNPIKKRYELDPERKYTARWLGKSDERSLEIEEKEQGKLYRMMRKRALETYKCFSNSHPS